MVLPVFAIYLISLLQHSKEMLILFSLAGLLPHKFRESLTREVIRKVTKG